jgi:hypothetical protein
MNSDRENDGRFWYRIFVETQMQKRRLCIRGGGNLTTCIHNRNAFSIMHNRRRLFIIGVRIWQIHPKSENN